MRALLLAFAAIALASCAPSLEALRQSSSTRTVTVARTPDAIATCLMPKLDAIRVGLFGFTFPTHRREAAGTVSLFAQQGVEYIWLVDVRAGEARVWTSGGVLYGGDLVGDIAAMTAECDRA